MGDISDSTVGLTRKASLPKLAIQPLKGEGVKNSDPFGWSCSLCICFPSQGSSFLGLFFFSFFPRPLAEFFFRQTYGVCTGEDRKTLKIPRSLWQFPLLAFSPDPLPRFWVHKTARNFCLGLLQWTSLTSLQSTWFSTSALFHGGKWNSGELVPSLDLVSCLYYQDKWLKTSSTVAFISAQCCFHWLPSYPAVRLSPSQLTAWHEQIQVSWLIATRKTTYQKNHEWLTQ